MPADVVVVRIDGVSDPALGLDAEDERIQELLSRDRLHFRERDDSRSHRAGRVDDRLQVGVVEIEDVARHSIDEGGIHDVEPLAAAEQRGLLRAGERRERCNGDIDRLVSRSTDRHADPVQQRAHALLADVGGQIIVARRYDVPGERTGDVLGDSGDGRWRLGLRKDGVGGHRREWKRGRGLKQRPAISVHVMSPGLPCDGVVKTISRPAVTVTPRLKPRSFVAICP